MEQPLGRRTLLGAGLAIVAGSLAAACSAGRDGESDESSPGPGADPIESVAMIGDSITVGSELALRQNLGALDLDVAIDAQNGRRIAVEGGTIGSGIGAVARFTATDPPPDLWVIALGTNDVGQHEGADEYARVIGELVDLLPADAPIVWVDAFVALLAERSREFNRTLREVLDRRGRAIVVDWAGVADDEGMLRDGIHPSDAGIQQFAALVTAAVQDWTV